MKKKNLVLALTMTLVIGLGATAYAASSTASSSAAQGSGYRYGCMSGASGYGMGRIEGFRGYDILTQLLESKGVTADEISAARDSGKTLVDLLHEKGVTDEEIKSYMLDQRTKLIDEALSSGKITESQAADMKERLSENNASCVPGQGYNGESRHKGGCGMYRSGN
jgi:hypothetical protein